MAYHTCSTSFLFFFHSSISVDRISRWSRWEGGSGAELSEQQTENDYRILWQFNQDKDLNYFISVFFHSFNVIKNHFCNLLFVYCFVWPATMNFTDSFCTCDAASVMFILKQSFSCIDIFLLKFAISY